MFESEIGPGQSVPRKKIAQKQTEKHYAATELLPDASDTQSRRGFQSQESVHSESHRRLVRVPVFVADHARLSSARDSLLLALLLKQRPGVPAGTANVLGLLLAQQLAHLLHEHALPPPARLLDLPLEEGRLGKPFLVLDDVLDGGVAVRVRQRAAQSLL